MFTAVEIEWLKSFLIEHLVKNGEFKYYVAYTIDNTSSSYNAEQYDFYLFVSNEEIKKTGLAYETQGSYQLIKVDSSSASSNYNNARYVIETGIGKSVTVNNYNHVFSNCENGLDANIIALEQYNQNIYLEQKYDDYVSNIVISTLLLISILLTVFKTAFPNRVGD